MTKEAFRDLPIGTKLLVKSHFTEGNNSVIRKWLGKVITFDHTYDGKWIYFKEVLGQPFRFDEIECVAEELIIDADVQYELGDMSLIFGEVSS